MTQIANGITEGAFPQKEDEVVLSANAAAAFQVQLGDRITLHTPAGDTAFTISGFGSDDKSYYENQTYLIGVYMTQTAFTSLMKENGITDTAPTCYIRFQNAAKAAKALPNLSSQYELPQESISENTGIMGTAGYSSSTTMKNIYGIAAILFVLVLLAGILMISGSMNSNVAQRIQFFGMMRCIGASRRQIVQFVRLEALNWCKTAAPLGLVLGTLISCGICAVLHYGIGGEFSTTPVFQISPVGLISGAAVGIVTVLLAAQAPARRVARVSPAAAVSGNTEGTASLGHASKLPSLKIDCFLGIHHAAASKKNWCFMTVSFALSILLFFSFSVAMDLAGLLLPALNVTSADIALTGYGNELVFDRDFLENVRAINGVATA